MSDLDPMPLPEVDRLVRRFGRLLAFTAVLVVVLLVVVTALEIQVQSRNRDIRRVEHVTATARDASQRAEKAVNDAVAAGNKSSSTFTPQVVKAFATIDLIQSELAELLKANGVH